MAVFLNDMNITETVALTQAMVESGIRYDLSRINRPKVDKHSTGGIGDKVSLILAPLAAACGLAVPMMSGRGLGFSGGTLDKLESISGFDVNLSNKRFEEILGKIGCSMIGQSDEVAPADKKLYALRDVTATVECIPLIVASILSKKIAEGTDSLIIDLKVGSGAFMKTLPQAKKLGKILVSVGKGLGLNIRAIITGMHQPLGYAVGNSVEVCEAIELLRSNTYCSERFDAIKTLSSSDLKEVTIQLCAHMLQLGKKVHSLAEGRKLAHKKLTDGSAWQVFYELVRLQNGSLEEIETPKKLRLSTRTISWNAKKAGYISKIDSENIGKIIIEMGGGRKQAADTVDPKVGLLFHKKLGGQVKIGDQIVTVLAPETQKMDDLEAFFHESIEISPSRKPIPKLLLETIS